MPSVRYGVVSDEIDGDPAVAFAVARRLGMGSVDLNSLWGRPVTDLSAGEVRAVGDLARQNGLSIFMVAGLPFKALPVRGLAPDALLSSAEYAAHAALLERSLEIAAALGARCARVHAFAWLPGGASPPRRPDGGEIPPEAVPAIVAGLRDACARAERHGVRLGLENVRASHANSGRNTAAILAAVDHPLLRLVWDPANAYVSGEERPFPDGYRAVRRWVDHVHAKDAKVVLPAAGTTAWECIGRGAVDWAGQLRALAADGYTGDLCVETHWRPSGGSGEEATRAAFAELVRLRAEARA